MDTTTSLEEEAKQPSAPPGGISYLEGSKEGNYKYVSDFRSEPVRFLQPQMASFDEIQGLKVSLLPSYVHSRAHKFSSLLR